MIRNCTIINADVLDGLAILADESIHCVVTSPPYWALRDYGVEGQVGLEKTPVAYLERMVGIFREVRRVLRADGTLWLNMGDSYAANRTYQVTDNKHLNVGNNRGMEVPLGLKPKDLVCMPWRLALALQADGWWLRSDIIWHKPNPMPESCTDRPTKSHEYIFLLTKAARYFYDAEAIKELAQDWGNRDRSNWSARINAEKYGQRPHKGGENGNFKQSGRNKRTVWTMPTVPYPAPHYATFPPALPETCIKAGTSERGVCPECGVQWARVVDIKQEKIGDSPMGNNRSDGKRPIDREDVPQIRTKKHVTTTDWRPGCECGRNFINGSQYVMTPKDPIPATVLDPFNGHGTTGLVAARLGRSYIGIEINPKDCEATKARIEGDNPLFNIVTIR